MQIRSTFAEESAPDDSGAFERHARISMVAPVVPFRGGIAQHSTMLANALGVLSDVSVHSYRCLYPGWLYPGKSTREPETAISLDVPVSYSIDSINPLTWRRLVRTLQAEQPQAVLVPWWTAVLGGFYLYLMRRLKALRLPVVFMCHNVVDHEAGIWKRRTARAVLAYGSAFIVQTSAEEARLKRLVATPCVARHPHPVYSHFPAPQETLPRKAAIELLFFGAIRHYKGLDVLLQAMAMLRDVSCHLTVVGEPWWKEGQAALDLVREHGLENSVELVLRYVSDREAANYFARADAVVLPYRAATGTGVVAAAYHYRKPIIGTRISALTEVTVEGENALLVPVEDAAELANAIRAFASRGLPNVETVTAALLERMSWNGLAQTIMSAAQVQSPSAENSDSARGSSGRPQA